MSEMIKITIEPKEVMDICSKALNERVIELGIDGDKDFSCEKWFVNCKRKGIVFKGFKNDDTELIGTSQTQGQKRKTGDSIQGQR